jgi:hypothetical protein
MITLENTKINASISTEMGMSLIDFRIYDRNILNKELKDDFLKIRKGLEPIILSHFNQASPVKFKNIDPNNKKFKIFSSYQIFSRIGHFSSISTCY